MWDIFASIGESLRPHLTNSQMERVEWWLFMADQWIVGGGSGALVFGLIGLLTYGLFLFIGPLGVALLFATPGFVLGSIARALSHLP
jgi:hypothetical protein